MGKPRKLTKPEMQRRLIEHIWNLVDHWEQAQQRDVREKLGGLAFSMLAMIDGSAVEIPALMLVPMPHKKDKKYFVERGANYYPKAALKNDIAGDLHGQFYKLEPKQEKRKNVTKAR